MLVTCVVVAALTAGTHGYGGGSGRSACRSMRVAHGTLQQEPSPYSLSLPDSPSTYSAGNQVKGKFTRAVNTVMAPDNTVLVYMI